jgi:hypothetical protein
MTSPNETPRPAWTWHLNAVAVPRHRAAAAGDTGPGAFPPRRVPVRDSVSVMTAPSGLAAARRAAITALRHWPAPVTAPTMIRVATEPRKCPARSFSALSRWHYPAPPKHTVARRRAIVAAEIGVEQARAAQVLGIRRRKGQNWRLVRFEKRRAPQRGCGSMVISRWRPHYGLR